MSLDEIKKKLAESLKRKPSWASESSEFINALSYPITEYIYTAVLKVENEIPENFISIARRRSSVIAKAQDQLYLPRPPYPSKGKVNIRNLSEQSITNLCGIAAESNEGIKYLIESDIILNPGESTVLPCEQLEKLTYKFTANGSNYQQVTIPNANKISRYNVIVDNEKWEQANELVSINSEDKIFIAIHTPKDEYNLIFGDNLRWGKPKAGSIIKVEAYITSSSEIAPLLKGSELFITSDLPLEIKVNQQFYAGVKEEQKEEIVPSYFAHLIQSSRNCYEQDFEKALKEKFPHLTFIKCWGENEEEKYTGPLFDNVNKLFFKAISKQIITDQEHLDFETEAVSFLKNKKVFNLTPVYKKPRLKAFSVIISGKIERTKTIEQVKSDILKVFDIEYGLYSSKRRENITDDTIKATLIRSDAFNNKYEVAGVITKTRNSEPSFSYNLTTPVFTSSSSDIIHIPPENITINLSYVDF